MTREEPVTSSVPARFQKAVACALAMLLLPLNPALAGGPIVVGGPSVGVPGTIITWDNTKTISYRVDSGPLSQQPGGGMVVIPNSDGLKRVQAMFDKWTAVPTANLAIASAGGLLGVGSFPANGDVKTVTDFLAVAGDSSGQAPDPNSCYGGGQSPIIFDADGSIFGGLGLPPGVIGFEFGCTLDSVAGKIRSAGAVLNGRFQDGINDPNTGNFELTKDQFDQVFTHEFGHFFGLDHSQINLDLFLKAINRQSFTCTPDDTAGMPLMFPVIGICPAKVTSGLPILAADDAAWISKLYPVASPAPPGKTDFNSAYGTLSGTVFFSDGVTPAQGVNVIARNTSLPRRNAVSVVSGFLYTGNPGQTRTCFDPANPTPQTCSNLGSPFGSHDPALIGHYEIPLPPGTYTIQIESIFDGFGGGSGVGPLDPPIPAPGSFGGGTVSVTAGGATNFNIILQGAPQRFDPFESAALTAPSQFALLRRERFARERQS